jgi:hypothetical protein
MTSFETDMDWNIVCKFNSKYCLKHKIAKIKEGFLVNHLGGLEEISPIMQTWVRDLTSPSLTEQKTMCTVSEKWLSNRPYQYNQQPYTPCKLMCALCTPLTGRLNFIKGLKQENVYFPVLTFSRLMTYIYMSYRTANLQTLHFYIFIQKIYVLNILNMLHTPHFFLFKMPFIS